ncbi:MAG TPA: protein kinase [Acidisarcina sp.]
MEQLLSKALELAPGQRSAYLDHVCLGAPELRRQIDDLLLRERHQALAGNGHIESAQNGSTHNTDPTVSLRDTTPAAGPSSRSHFTPGQTIAGRFTVVRFIARGGMGEVYEAKDKLLQGTHVALKMILPEIAVEASASQRFEQEVLLARRVNHANLCPIYEIFRCDEPPAPFLFLTMKLLAGQTLATRLLEPGLIPAEDALQIFRQMVCGIAAIHAAGVIHRDIKPNNVMLDRSGGKLCVSIMDFGLARLHEADSTLLKPGMVAGTPGYLAPELLHGHPPSQATDIFALGVLLHQVLTGKRPPETPNHRPSLTLLDAVAVTGKAPGSPSFPAGYVHAVRDFLAEDPERRCRAFAGMQVLLDSGSASSALLARPPLFTRRSFAIGSAATVIAAAGGGLWKRRRIYDFLHPLPDKRFVALLGWPPPSDLRIKPALLSVMDAIGNELARAEAYDRNLSVIAHASSTDPTTSAQLNDVRESLGANLVLATSGSTVGNSLSLLLQVIDPATAHPLRTTEIHVAQNDQLSLAARAVRAAADLLDITGYEPDDRRSSAGTRSPEALAAFQAAEALMKQPNFTGVDAAIDKYKEAVGFDVRYALAYARLAIAYTQMFITRKESGALALAQENAHTSLRWNHNLVEGHVALATAYAALGQSENALRALGEALSLDPANPQTLTYQAEIYSTLNRWDDAERTLLRVIEERPNYWLAHFALGFNYGSQGKYRQALQAFQGARIALPNSALTLNNIGDLQFVLGMYDQALDSLAKSMALHPNADAANTTSQVLLAQGNYVEALQYSEQAVKLGPVDSRNWLQLGDCYEARSKDSVKARSAYLRAEATEEENLRTNPSNGPGWMLLALYRVKTIKLSQIDTLIKKAESLHADDIDSQLYKARILELLNHRESALATLALCFSKGATRYQIECVNDLSLLRKDPRYPILLNAPKHVLNA